jgi:hypothetical protein
VFEEALRQVRRQARVIAVRGPAAKYVNNEHEKWRARRESNPRPSA